MLSDTEPPSTVEADDNPREDATVEVVKPIAVVTEVLL